MARAVWRGAAVLVLVLTSLTAGGGVASAHGVNGLMPTTSSGRVVSIEPPVPGLQVTVIEAGTRLRIDNQTDAPVDVLPPAGQARTGEPIVPVGATARWIDRRTTDAAAAGRPPFGERAWAIPVRLGGQAATIHGVEAWPDPPPAVWWWLATLVTAALATLVGVATVYRVPPAVSATASAGSPGPADTGVPQPAARPDAPGHRTRRSPRAGRRRVRDRWIAVLGALAAVLMVTSDVVHALGSALIVDGQPFAAALNAAGIALLAWPLGLVGAVLTAAGQRFGPLVTGVSAAYIVLVTAFDVVGFTNAVMPFGWNPDLDRACTVVTLGLGVGLLAGGFTALRALGPDLSSDPLLPRTGYGLGP